MKKFILIYLLFNTLTSVSQEKPKLTINETVVYIDKKVNECVGHYRYPEGVTYKMYYKWFDVSYINDKLIITIRSSNYANPSTNSDYFVRRTTQTFNPANIISITESTINKSDPLGVIVVKLSGKIAVSEQSVEYYSRDNGYGKGMNFGYHNDSNTTSSSDEIGLVYLYQDASNFNKLKKALEHLKSLCKESDDPFGE